MRTGLLLASALVLVACGTKPSGFDGTDGEDAAANPTFDDDGGVSLPPGIDASSDGAASCATAKARPEYSPIRIVISYDKSASMLLFAKWDAAKAAFNAFFADPASKNISASLTFFPQGTACDVPTYAKPNVPLTPLPDKVTFANALGGQFPNGDTPTLPAIQGAIQYAQSLQGSVKTVIVLVTDGEPNVCSSTVQAVANAVATVANTIPTYVVGIGNVANLDTIAAAGGTKKATLISTTNAQQTADDLQKALNAIREEVTSCEYGIPPPPQGKTFEPGKANVVFTPSNGPAVTWPYDPGCTGGVGWHYDDPKNPKTIVLCPGSCATRKGDPKGTLDVVLGCKTVGQPVN
jgi:hypothetical protein